MDRWKACIIRFPCVVVFFLLGFSRIEVFNGNGMQENAQNFFSVWKICFILRNRRSGQPLDRGSKVTATLQARRLSPTNGGRPDTDPTFLYIYTYSVSSCWLFEQFLSSTLTRTCTQLGPIWWSRYRLLFFSLFPIFQQYSHGHQFTSNNLNLLPRLSSTPAH